MSVGNLSDTAQSLLGIRVQTGGGAYECHEARKASGGAQILLTPENSHWGKVI